MMGAPIDAVRNGVQVLVTTLRQDPQALESAYLSVITFDSTARQVVPLTDLATFQPPQIDATGVTALGDALQVTAQCIDREVAKGSATQKGDWKPLVFIMTDGQPTDDWQNALPVFRQSATGTVVACAAGPDADPDVLKQITNDVVTLATADTATISSFFKWVSASIRVTSQRIDAPPSSSAPGVAQLAPPPDDIIVI